MIVYFCSVWTGTSVWYLDDSANAILLYLAQQIFPMLAKKKKKLIKF